LTSEIIDDQESNDGCFNGDERPENGTDGWPISSRVQRIVSMGISWCFICAGEAARSKMIYLLIKTFPAGANELYQY
jgi:hypothetical protein